MFATALMMIMLVVVIFVIWFRLLSFKATMSFAVNDSTV